jgi:phospholipid/cholesterol/gamma-HCH transport system substrate-binding protein
MKSIFNKNFIIALVLVLGLGLLYWGIEFLKGANLFEPANYYITKFENVNGLNVSTPITVNGYQVGLVKELNYDYKTNMITVKMSLDDELKIPVGSSVQLSSELLGGASLSINLAKNTAYYKVGDEIPSITQSGLLDRMGQSIMPEVNQIMPKVNDILGNVNALVANPALNGSVSQFDEIVSKINSSANDLNVLLGHLNELSGGLKGSVPEVMSGVMGIEKNVNGTVTDLHNNLNTLTGTLNTKVNEIPTHKLETTINELNNTITELKGLTADLKSKLNDRNSSIGLLLNDRQLYDNANGAVMSLDSLLTDIKANPKRYITIKVF